MMIWVMAMVIFRGPAITLLKSTVPQPSLPPCLQNPHLFAQEAKLPEALIELSLG
jgi:hypothetical protein